MSTTLCRLRRACEGASKSDGGMNVGDIKKYLNKVGYDVPRGLNGLS